jgi:hypothetical protein
MHAKKMRSGTLSTTQCMIQLHMHIDRWFLSRLYARSYYQSGRENPSAELGYTVTTHRQHAKTDGKQAGRGASAAAQ